MSDLLQVLGILFVAAFLASAVVVVPYYLWLVQKLFTYLKLNHYQLWKEMGQPHVIYNNSLSTFVNLMGFLFGEKAQAMRDAALLALRDKIRVILVIYSAALSV